MLLFVDLAPVQAQFSLLPHMLSTFSHPTAGCRTRGPTSPPPYLYTWCALCHRSPFPPSLYWNIPRSKALTIVSSVNLSLSLSCSTMKPIFLLSTSKASCLFSDKMLSVSYPNNAFKVASLFCRTGFLGAGTTLPELSREGTLPRISGDLTQKSSHLEILSHPG